MALLRRAPRRKTKRRFKKSIQREGHEGSAWIAKRLLRPLRNPWVFCGELWREKWKPYAKCAAFFSANAASSAGRSSSG